MNEQTVAICATLAVTVGVILWYIAPQAEPRIELLFLGIWLMWVLAGTVMGTVLASHVQSRFISRSDLLQSLPSVDRRVVLVFVVTSLTAVFGGILVAILF